MPRHIDADALIKQLYVQSDDEGLWVATVESLEGLVNSIPTADVIERKRGKWIDYPIADGCLQCSVCGILRFEEANYCPNCGAGMRKERKND